MIRSRRWRAPDGALRVTATGLSCPRGYEGAASAMIDTNAGQFLALVPVAGSGRWLCVARRDAESDAAEAAEEFIRSEAVGCWSDGRLVLRDRDAEVAWAAEMLRRERAGLPVFWSEESREERRAA